MYRGGFNGGNFMPRGGGMGHMASQAGPQGFNWMFLISAGIKFLVFLVLLYIAYNIFKYYRDNSNPAIKILNEKYASGEISEEEFVKRRTLLTKRS